ncbi:MAG TPA: MBL fold metallo-hydrolase [Bacteroidales bacterium]|nr:MBL fold metallo-hydrolase [Bacteroidales bacterium]
MKFSITLSILIFTIMAACGQKEYEHDLINAQGGDIELWFIGHGTLMFKYLETVIHIDPVSLEGDYKNLPDADIVLITHSHGDHLDPRAIGMITRENTVVICNPSSSGDLINPVIMNNGDKRDISGIIVEAVPAYNIEHKRPSGETYHPKGDGNGYILTLGGKRIYVAGDTEHIPEMKTVGKVDIAFLPMNLPYTMDPEMAAEAARSIMPGILYPYHFGSSDTGKLVELVEGTGIEVRVRKL